MALSGTLAAEAARYLAAIDLFRSLKIDVEWRTECDEVGVIATRPVIQVAASGCKRCGSPLVRINGRHICLVGARKRNRNTYDHSSDERMA